MKTIKPLDVKSVKGKDVEAGMILAELGVVVSIDSQEMSHGRAQTVYFYNGLANQIITAKAEEYVQVLGKVNEIMLDAYKEVAA